VRGSVSLNDLAKLVQVGFQGLALDRATCPFFVQKRLLFMLDMLAKKTSHEKRFLFVLTTDGD